jgi:predicted HTH domain antitoxin
MIRIQLPELIEAQLRERLADLDQAAKEAALVEMYRQGHLTHHELAEALGLSRFETDGLLKRHNVTEDLQTPDEFSADLEAARRKLRR